MRASRLDRVRGWVGDKSRHLLYLAIVPAAKAAAATTWYSFVLITAPAGLQDQVRSAEVLLSAELAAVRALPAGGARWWRTVRLGVQVALLRVMAVVVSPRVVRWASVLERRAAAGLASARQRQAHMRPFVAAWYGSAWMLGAFLATLRAPAVDWRRRFSDVAEVAREVWQQEPGGMRAPLWRRVTAVAWGAHEHLIVLTRAEKRPTQPIGVPYRVQAVAAARVALLGRGRDRDLEWVAVKIARIVRQHGLEVLTRDVVARKLGRRARMLLDQAVEAAPFLKGDGRQIGLFGIGAVAPRFTEVLGEGEVLYETVNPDLPLHLRRLYLGGRHLAPDVAEQRDADGAFQPDVNPMLRMMLASLVGDGPGKALLGSLELAVLSLALTIRAHAKRTWLEVRSPADAVAMLAHALDQPGAVVEPAGEATLLRVWLPDLFGSEWEFVVSFDDTGRNLITNFYATGRDGLGSESTMSWPIDQPAVAEAHRRVVQVVGAKSGGSAFIYTDRLVLLAKHVIDGERVEDLRIDGHPVAAIITVPEFDKLDVVVAVVPGSPDTTRRPSVTRGRARGNGSPWSASRVATGSPPPGRSWGWWTASSSSAWPSPPRACPVGPSSTPTATTSHRSRRHPRPFPTPGTRGRPSPQRCMTTSTRCSVSSRPVSRPNPARISSPAAGSTGPLPPRIGGLS